MTVPGEKTHEIELKFTLSAEEARRLAAQPPWGAPAQPVELHSVYFDTPDQALRRGGFSLRVCKEGGRLVQTLKTLEGSGGTFAERGEWSRIVRSLKPVLTGRAGNLLRPVLGAPPDGTVLSLGKVFSIDVTRHRHEVVFDGARIEIAVDFGAITAGERHETFHELELELLEGPRAALFSFARETARRMPLRLHMQAKMERGFELLCGPAGASKAGKIGLSGDMTVREAFQRIAHSCLHHLFANEAAFRATRTPDAIHQTRVALRRMRAAMALFRDFTQDDLHRRLDAELRWCAAELGLARELDIYIIEILDKAPSGLKASSDYAGLRAEYEQSRAQAYDSAAVFLASPRFAHARLVLAQWIECGAWLAAAPDREMPLAEYAARQMRRRWKKVRREIGRHAALGDEARHAWRISIKKLRYACDFLAPLFSGDQAKGQRKDEPARRAMRHLASLQDSLGLLNDLAEARRRNPLSDIAAALYRERNKARDGLFGKIEADCAALTKLMPFWKKDF